MNRKDNTLEGIGAFTVILLAIFTLVISPALSFMFTRLILEIRFEVYWQGSKAQESRSANRQK